MASNSKSINLGGASAYIQRCTLTAYFNEESTSTSNNTSRIYVKASLYTPSASWDNVGRDDHMYIYWHDNRENYDRHVATWSGSVVNVGSTITAEGTIDVTHKDDGTLSGYAYAVWSRDGGNTNWAPESGSVATDWTSLTTIARASQPSINTYPNNSPDFDIGDTITIHMNRKSSSFTHTVTFNYGSTSVQVATGVTNNCTFDTSTIANDLYALIPNGNVYSSTISVKTYNGSTLIGTKTCAYNAHVVNSDPIFPDTTAGRIWVSNSNAIAQQTIGTYTFLQNVSIVRVGMRNASKAQAQNGASLVKMSCSFAGLYGEILAENIPSSGDIYFSLGTPTVYGLKTALLTALDSRGNSTTIAIQPFNSPNVPADNQYICPYINPSIVASAERQSNFENDTTISISGAISSIKTYQGTYEGNAVNSTNGIQYRYKESTSSTWGSWTNVASTTAGDGSVSTTDFVLSLDNQKEWDFEFKITDKITTTTITRHVGQGQPQFFIGADGRTSVGGVPQISMPSGNLGQLEVNGNAYANGNRLAELPITNSMLGSQCVKSDNVDWATLCPGVNKVVETTFCLNTPTQNAGTRFVTLTSHAGNAIKIAIDNGGSIFRIVDGGSKIVRVDQTWGWRSTSDWVNGYFGIIGLSNGTYWTRATGIENGWSYTNTEQSLSPEAQSSQGGYYGILKTGSSGSGGRLGCQVSLVGVRTSGIQSNGNPFSNLWSLMGKFNADGNLTYIDFSTQCAAYSAQYVPSVYQKGLGSQSGFICQILKIYEIVDY